MGSRVVSVDGSHRLVGEDRAAGLMNRFLEHLGVRAFSPATVRAYAFDLANFAVFLDESGFEFDTIHPVGSFDYLDWQRKRGKRGSEPAASTMNRRISTVRSWFGFLMTIEVMDRNPVPVSRRSNGLRTARRGMLGHTTDSVAKGSGGRLVRQPRRLPESLDPDDVAVFLADLNTRRDRAMVLALVLGGLRSAEIRSLRLADVDMGMKRVQVVGKSDSERIVPIDRVFFDEMAAYLRSERPAACSTPECFVVLRGPTAGRAMTEAGMRKIFRVHRQRTGATRVHPHRLRHTYATELAGAGIDLLALRDLMGHASLETTARYVHLAPEALAAEFVAARAVIGR